MEEDKREALNVALEEDATPKNKQEALKDSLQEDAHLINKVQKILGAEKYCRLEDILENEELFHEFRNASMLDISILDNEQLLPLTNVALSCSKLVNLQTILQREVKAREKVEMDLGKESVQKISDLVKNFDGQDFVEDDISDNIELYHLVRNIAVKCVLERLQELYSNPKMQPILSQKTDNADYNNAVKNLKYLVTVTWQEKFAKAEDLNFDLDFLKIILDFWQSHDKGNKKKSEGKVESKLDNQSDGETKDAKIDNPEEAVHLDQNVSSQDEVMKTDIEFEVSSQNDLQDKAVIQNANADLQTVLQLESIDEEHSGSNADSMKDGEDVGDTQPEGSQKNKKFVSSNLGKIFNSKLKSEKTFTSKNVIENETDMEKEATIPKFTEEDIMSAPIFLEQELIPSDINESLPVELSVDTIKKLKEHIFNSPEIKKKILDIAGDEKMEKFLQMVNIFDSSQGHLAVENDKIKNLYYCIRNASICDSIKVLDPTLFPLSNLSLSVEMFNQLRMFIKRDESLLNLIKGNGGTQAFEKFENLIVKYLDKGDDYIQEDISFNIFYYHSIRNATMKFILSKLHVIVVKTKLNSEDNSNDAIYVAAIDRLSETIAMDWNQRILNSEENKFDFGFTRTIIKYLKQSQGKPETKLTSSEPLIIEDDSVENSSESVSTKKCEKSVQKTDSVLKEVQAPLKNEKSIQIDYQINKEPLEIKTQTSGSLQNKDDDPDDPDAIGDCEANENQVKTKNNEEPVKITTENKVKIKTNEEPIKIKTHTSVSLQNEDDDPDDPDAIGDGEANKNKDFVKGNHRIIGTKVTRSIANKKLPQISAKICCSLCSDKNSSNLDALLRHYSLKHFRDSIENKYVPSWTGSCDLCKKTMNSKPELIMHIGVEHDSVQLEISARKGGFQCPICKKEFLNETFYKQHMIGTHFNNEMTREFLTSGYQLKCKFCTKDFENKRSILNHIGMDHDKLEPYLLPYRKSESANQAKEEIICKLCNFTTNFSFMKVHYLEDHFFENLANKFKEENLLNLDNCCVLCKETTKNERELIRHLAIRHNQILKFIDTVPAKFVKAQFRIDNIQVRYQEEMGANSKVQKEKEVNSIVQERTAMNSISRSDPSKVHAAPPVPDLSTTTATNSSPKLITKPKLFDSLTDQSEEGTFLFDPLLGPLNDFTTNVYNDTNITAKIEETVPDTSSEIETIVEPMKPLKPKSKKVKTESQKENKSEVVPKSKLKFSFTQSKMQKLLLPNDPSKSCKLIESPLKPSNAPENKFEDITNNKCKVCKENILQKDVRQHFIMIHYRKLSLSRLKEVQKSADNPKLACPNKTCLKVLNNEDSLIAHFASHYADPIKEVDTPRKLNSVPVPVSQLMVLPVEVSQHEPVSVPDSKPQSAPLPDLKPMPVLISVLESMPVPVPASPPVKVLVSALQSKPIPVQVSAPKSKPAPVTVPISQSTPVSVPVSQSGSVSVLDSKHMPVPLPPSKSMPVSVPASQSRPVPVPNSKPTQVSVQSKPVRIPSSQLKPDPMAASKPTMPSSQPTPDEVSTTESIPSPLLSKNEEVQLLCQPCRFTATGEDQLVVHRQALGHKFKVIKSFSSTGSASNRTCLVCEKEFPQQHIFNHLETAHWSRYITTHFKIPKTESKHSVLKVEIDTNVKREIVDLSENKEQNKIEGQKTEEKNKQVGSYWFTQFKNFCNTQKDLPEVQDFFKSHFRICNSSVMNDFLEKVLTIDNNFSNFDEITKDLEESGIGFEDDKDMQDLQIMKRYSLLKEYGAVCENLGTSMENCDIMHIIIFLSQLLARPNVAKKDVEWTLLTISDFHTNVDGNPLKEDKKIVDFFEAIGIVLLSKAPTSQKEFVIPSNAGNNHKMEDEKLSKVFNQRSLKSLPTNNNKTDAKEVGSMSSVSNSIADSSQLKLKRKISDNSQQESNKKNRNLKFISIVGPSSVKSSGKRNMSMQIKKKKSNIDTNYALVEEQSQEINKKNNLKPVIESSPKDDKLNNKNQKQKTEKTEGVSKTLTHIQFLLSEEKELSESIIDITEDVSGRPIEGTGELLENIVEIIEEVSGNPIKKTGEVSKNILEIIEELPGIEIIEELPGRLTEKTEEISGRLTTKTKDVTEKIEEVPQELTEATRGLPEVAENLDTSEKIEEVPQELTETAGGLPEEVAENLQTSIKIEGVPQELTETAGGLPEEVSENIDTSDDGYMYYCLECDGCSEDNTCDHTSHSRHLLGFDIAEHFRKTGHLDYRPMDGFMQLGRMEDLAHSAQWGNTIRKRWKQLVLAGMIQTTKYPEKRGCKRKACFEVLGDPLTTFKHIRIAHL